MNANSGLQKYMSKEPDIFVYGEALATKMTKEMRIPEYNTIIQGLPEDAVFRGLPRFDLAEVKTPADPAGVGVKIFSGVKSPPGSG